MPRSKTTPRSPSRPILRKALPRERLFQQLDRFQEGPIIWVSGPGGCGKTTLVSSYLQDRDHPSLWYQVEAADKDLAMEFCRGAMVCCRNLGLRAEGLSLYRRFEKRLKTELGIEPAGRTREIRDSLLGGDGR